MAWEIGGTQSDELGIVYYEIVDSEGTLLATVKAPQQEALIEELTKGLRRFSNGHYEMMLAHEREDFMMDVLALIEKAENR